MIDILLSTYNGKKYLATQLDSILNQTYQQWNLIIRDDGSSDSTRSILNQYLTKYPDKITIIESSKNIGVIKSFETLLNHSKSQYIMFCDQDDIWLPNKIELTYNTLRELESKHSTSTPIAVHTDLTLINEQGDITHNSFWQFANIRPELLNHNLKFLAISNSATGCTLMINEALKNIVLPFPQKVYMHDMLIALKACKHGILHPIYQPTMLYRQHGNNTIGAIQYDYNVLNKIKNFKNVIVKAHQMYYYSTDIYKNILDFWFTKFIYYTKIRNKK